jgi:hypothetical protein
LGSKLSLRCEHEQVARGVEAIVYTDEGKKCKAARKRQVSDNQGSSEQGLEEIRRGGESGTCIAINCWELN